MDTQTYRDSIRTARSLAQRHGEAYAVVWHMSAYRIMSEAGYEQATEDGTLSADAAVSVVVETDGQIYE